MLPDSTRHRVSFTSPSLPVYHEQIPRLYKAIFDSIQDVVMLRRFKVDMVELKVVRP